MSTWQCRSCSGQNPEGMKFCGHCGTPAVAPPEDAAAAPGGEPEVASALRSFVSKQVAHRLEEAGGWLNEERRLVTALFADISGFTPLADRLDPEELTEVIDPVIKALTDVVGRYEGHVEKFAGDALLALFGAPVAHEDDAQRGLMVALEMHRVLEELRPRLPEAGDLTLHVGINSGHAVARIFGSEARLDYSVLGDSVILAQRLESAAPAAETYVGETTYRLTKHRFEFEWIGELTLKGKEKPVPAWKLVGEVAPSGRELEPRAALPLIGRERELEQVTRLLDEATEGRGGLVAVTGEPGVGKSRLLREIGERARERGIRWLETRCLSYGAAIPYWPYSLLIRNFALIEINSDPERAAAALLSALRRIGADAMVPYFCRLLGLPLPDDVSDTAPVEPEAFQRGLHQAVAAWLALISETEPLAVVIEDVHWLDASSRALTEELARMAVDHPVLFCLTGRAEATQAIEGIRSRLPTERSSHLSLAPLDVRAITSLLDRLLGAPAPGVLARLVAERAGGNPFFVEEIVDSLRDQGALVASDQGLRLRADWDPQTLPPTVEEVLAARIDMLPSPSRMLLLEASVIGRTVPLELLRRVATEVEDLEGGIQILLDRAFLDATPEDPDRMLFHHALVQEAAYSRLLRRQKRTLHRRVADKVEKLYGAGDDVVDLLARHLYLGGVGAKATQHLLRAGERARRLFANEEAILHLTRALEVAPDDDPAERVNRPAIQLTLADLHELTGNYDAAFDLYSRVNESSGDVRALRGMTSVLRRQGRLKEAVAVVDEAFERVGAPDERAALWLERGWLASAAEDIEQAIEAFGAGIRSLDNRHAPVAAQLLVQLGMTETIAARYSSALEHLEEATRILEEVDDVRGLATAQRVLGGTYSDLGRFDEAAAALRRALELGEKVGSIEEIAGSLINLGLAEHRRGNLDAAIEADRRAIVELERVGHVGRGIAYSNLSEKLLDAQQLEEAAGSAEVALQVAASSGDTATEADALQMLAKICLAQTRYGQAAELAERAAELNVKMGTRQYAVEAFELAADALQRSGQEERARSMLERARSAVAATSGG